MVLTKSYPIPPNEAERLAALERLQVVGTPRSLEFDAVLTFALNITGCRAGLIGLMEGDRHWFKSECGLGRPEMPREISLGNYTLLQSDPLIVEDLRRDARFRDNPLVLERDIRFYAGVALADEDGFKVGTLCLTDGAPRAATPGLERTLRNLGRLIETLLKTFAQVAKAATLSGQAAAREREMWKKNVLLSQSERLAQVGAWELDVKSNVFIMSDEGYRIHELELGTAADLNEIWSRQSADYRATYAALFKTCLETGQGYEVSGQFVTARGKRRWVHVIAEADREGGEVVRLFGSLRDVTAERDAERSLWHAAHYDALTGAPNRHFWTKTLDQAVAGAITDQSGVTILMFDLDGFKEINDTRGHAFGDVVLCEVARRLEESLPEAASHARLGGDEFAVLLQGSWSAASVEDCIRGLLAAIERPIVVEVERLQISGTFGAASFPADATTAADLMQKADIALYQAKRSHRRSFVSFRSEIGDLFNDKRHAIDLVAASIEQNRLVPFYQLKVDLKTGGPVGFEALCRIEAADGTILGPNQFLPALQDAASSARIGAAMLDLVTADIAAWRAEGLTPGRVAFNVTSSDFATGDLDRRVLDRLGTLGLSPTALEIEVTENTILGEEALVVGKALHAMRDQGIVIALDDFGTGYASLTHLRDAPIHYLKLDRSFIMGLGHGAESAIIVRSIVDLGHSLGMRIVAEGIETKGQADFLRAVGCDEAQGFLYGRPASRIATRAWLGEQANRNRDATAVRGPLQAGYFNLLARRWTS